MKASFTRFDRGLLHGSFGFRVSLAYPEGPARRLFTELDKFREKYPWVERLIYFVGNTPGMEEAVGIAKERGWHVAAELNGQGRPAWIDKVDYRVLVVGTEEWVPIRFNELLYYPGKHSRLIEPVVPREFGGYLYLFNEGRELKEIFEFMQGAKRTWRLYEEPEENPYEMDLDLG